MSGPTAQRIADAVREAILTFVDLDYDDLNGGGLPLRPDVCSYILEELLAPGSAAFDLSGALGGMQAEMREDGTVTFTFKNENRVATFRVLCRGVVWVDRTYNTKATCMMERLPEDQEARNAMVAGVRSWLLGRGGGGAG